METILTKDLNGGIGSSWDAAHQRLLVAEWGGSVVAVDEHGRHVLGTGYTQLEDIAVSVDGSWALVTERGGSLLRTNMNNPDRANARVVASGLMAPHQIALVEAHHTAYLVEYGTGGRLLRFSLANGAMQVVATGLTNAVGLVVDRSLTTAYVTEQTTGTGQVIAVSLSSGTRRTLATGLVAPFMLAWEDSTESTLLVAERDPANRVSAVAVHSPARTALDWSRFIEPRVPRFDRIPRPTPMPTPSVLPDMNLRLADLRRFGLQPRLPRVTRRFTGVGARPSSIQSVPGLGIFVVSDREAVRYDTAPAPLPRVEMDVDTEPMFIGAYQRVPVRISGAGLTFDDIDFEVLEGPQGGRISSSKDDRFDPADPHVMLLAGYEPGAWTLQARRRSDGTTLGSVAFKTTDLWVGPDGPPLWFEGISQANVTGSAWGGGTSGPQNIDVVPANGTRRVAVLLVDTNTQRYPTDTTALRQEWADETFNGVTVGGKTVSSHHYLQELSGGSYGLANAGVVGPVQLPGAFEDYFTLNPDGLWVWRAGFFQSAVTAGDALIDFSQIDSLVVVVRSAPAADATSPVPAQNMRRFAWPWATGGTFATAEGNAAIAVVVMPHDWGDSSDREIYDTLTHELGHNMGLPDLYMDGAFGAVAARDVGSWDVMSWDDPLPHMSVANKMRLGWIRPPAVKTYNFAGSGSGAVDETITLRASELGAPPAGEFSAIEVRIANGWNYYFEYRSQQTTQIGDQQLTANQRVLGTDVVSPSHTAPVVRRDIILLRNDPDGDGPILTSGEDYEETDVSDPLFPTDFNVTVVSTTANTATVRLRYGANSRPDPSIRPWPGSGTNAWQSPDIEVLNDRNAIDPSRRNVPWAGHPNRIVAKVRNVGSLLARNVRVNFSVKDFTVGGVPEFPLGSTTADVPAGATVDISLDGWVPGAGSHYCVVARMPLYIDNGPPVVVEMTELNNAAQSNYTEFISASASPATRQRTYVTVGNPYGEPTRVQLVPRQTNPFFRTYLSHTLVDLAPGEQRRIEVMFESLHGSPDINRVFEQPRNGDKERMYREPNIVNVTGYVEDPRDTQLHSVHAMGGVIARVVSGIATTVDAGADGEALYGRVIASDGSTVASGEVIAAVRRDGDVMREVTSSASVTNGSFKIPFEFNLNDQNLEIVVEYLGATPWAPSPEVRIVT